VAVSRYGFVSKYRFATFVLIAAIIVCALGILILPQVDLPDFVLNGSKCPTIAKAHCKIASTLLGERLPGPSLSPRTNGLSRSVLLVQSANVFAAWNKAVSLRC